LEDKKVKNDPVIAPVVLGLSAIGLEPGTAENRDMAPEVTPPLQAIPAQEINPKVLMWDNCKATFLLYPTLEEYKGANERMIRDQESRDSDDRITRIFFVKCLVTTRCKNYHQVV
jgi:hypothetical protein